MTLVVQREEPPYKYVVVEGTVVETTSPAPQDVREATWPSSTWAKKADVPSPKGCADVPSVLFTIRPDRWITADFSDEL